MKPFTIRTAQFEGLALGVERIFVRSLADFLREEVPDARDDPPEELLAFTSAMVRKAAGYGLILRRDAAIYTICAYLLGENFEEHFHPALRTLNSKLPSPDKAEWLQNATVVLIDSQGRLPQ
jgi:hypothetical protein